MKFGQVENPANVDFTLPATPAATMELLRKKKKSQKGLQVCVGCAKWNKQDLKGFYPRGIKDELAYYATQFNSIELNATFYHSPTKEQVEKWREKTPPDFKFFPKIPQTISHYGRLLHTKERVIEFCDAIALFEEKLGMAFLQMHDHFKPKDFDRLKSFLEDFPAGIPLAVEVRNEEWFANKEASDSFFQQLERLQQVAVLVDTAGRRDMLHMRLTKPTAFIRFVGANHASDYSRMDEWVERIYHWHKEGLKGLYFFVHQNVEVESPLLAAYFIDRLNERLGLSVRKPYKSGLF